jgi:hypothetical protein
MKRLGTIGVVVTFVSAATMALAACTSYPSGRQMDTSAAQEAPGTYPAAASQGDRNRSTRAVYTPAWPYSVPGP